MNRREFLQTAAAALSAAPLAGRAAFADGRGALAFDAVIFDARHAEARDFGARAALLGVPMRAIEGDITEVWQNELLPLWRNAPAAIAGLTERPALFLLERLAWEHDLRVVFEAEHASDAHAVATHRVLRSGDPRLADDLGFAGRRWPSVLADVLIAGGRAPAADTRPTDAGLAAYLGEPTKLYSWIIAPRAAVRKEI